MADQSGPVNSIDPYERLNLVRNPDGTITRIPFPKFLDVPATGDSIDSDVISKDVPLNQANKTSVRIYRPRNATKDSNLPLIIYYHGGGFIFFSAASLPFDDLCVRMALEISAVIVSVDYRLAPEHRLPAAYEDAVEAVLWVKNQALDHFNGEPWLRDYVDFSKCFIMGCSAGGNMVYHAALRLSKLGSDQLQPLKICGLILNQPSFSGIQRTASELRLMNDPILPLAVVDLMKELSMPSGADGDHEYCNLTLKGLSESVIEAMKSQRWLVFFGGEDPLMDKQKEFLKMLEESGVKFVAQFDENACHGNHIFDPEKALALLKALREFIY
ncbi:hypothetical protein NE237_012972 [Protea cynaroides]|uniref:Alpha/beta hydrolase fold-3 domain-containing protein n=1 Tax=Protea cynaroides TaxID=273540 RepID=A0A9Q0GYZ8_9MAGN|nr:hypothetical protein NE237_012972 [Protea cynaroides]